MNKLLLNAPINSLGYGVASTNILYELSKILEVFLLPIGPIEITEDKYINCIQQTQNLKNCDFDTHIPALKIWHQHDLIMRPGNGKYSAFPFFELDRFNEQEKINLNCPDKLIVASKWAQEIIKEQIGRYAYIVPLGIDPEIFYPTKPNEGTFKFLNISKNEVRKGHDIITQAFNDAFDDNDDVELHLLTYNPFPQVNNNEWAKNFKSGPLADKIVLHNRVKSHKEIANLIRSCDVGVYPSRAEGFLLDALETLACGKKNIITNYSAQTEYSNADNSYLIDITEKEPANDGVWFFGQGSWAKLGKNQYDQLVDHMRHAYYNNVRDNPAGLKTAQEFTWAKSAKKLIKVME